MAYQIEIADSGERAYAEPGETLLDAALRAGVALPYSCQAGNCGTCKCEYLSGEIFELEHSEHALKAEERARNVILACRTQVWGDVAVRRIEAEELVLHPSRVMRCRVTALERLTHDIREVRLSIESGGPLNMPGEAVLVFQIRHMPRGRTSSFVAEHLKIGEGVRVSGPLGVSYLRDKHIGPVLLIAGGSGLAPIGSILRSVLARGYGEAVGLYFGVRTERDIYHEPLLKDLATRHANFRYQVVLSEQRDTERRVGFVHEAVATDISDFTGYKAYLAGPPPMVEAVTEMLLAKGLPQRDIHADAFYDQT